MDSKFLNHVVHLILERIVLVVQGIDHLRLPVLEVLQGEQNEVDDRVLFARLLFHKRDITILRITLEVAVIVGDVGHVVWKGNIVRYVATILRLWVVGVNTPATNCQSAHA